jgi:tetratricopeptide (TPR) repeat protein
VGQGNGAGREGLLGRADELARGRRFIAAAASGPACLVIEGAPGIGKTTLWKALVAEARTVGSRVLVGRPAENETELGLACLADLLGPIARDVRPILAPPQRRAMDVALLLADPGTEPTDLRALGAALLAALRELARRSPVIVAVDDAQWADAASVRALEFAARRLSDEPVRFLLTRRSASQSDALDRAFAGRSQALELGPFSLGALHRLIESRAGISLARPALIHLERASGGNPLLALDIVEAVRRSGMSLTPGAIVPVPAELDRMVAERLAALPSTTRDALLTVSAMARPTMKAVGQAATVSTDVTSALAPAIEAGLVEVDGERIRFAHPLYRSGVYLAAPLDRRAALHRRLATVVDDPDEAALHLASGVTGTDAAAARAVAAAAVQAHRRGALDTAATLFDHAVRLTPASESSSWATRALALARIEWERGDIERSRALIEQVVPALPAGPDRAAALILRGMHLLWTAGPTDAIPVFLDAVAEAGDDRKLEATAHLRIAYAADHDLSLAAGHAGAAADILDVHSDGDSDMMACAMLMSVEIDLMAGRGFDSRRFDRARQLLELPPHPRDPRTAFDARAIARERSWLLHAARDDLETARAELAAIRSDDDDRGLDRAAPITFMDLSELSCLLGDVDAARRYAEDAAAMVEQTGRLPYASAAARYAAALVAEHTGELDTASGAASEARDRVGSEAPSPLLDRIDVLLARIDLMRGAPRAAARRYRSVEERVENAGIRWAAVHRFRGDLVESLVLSGQLEEAASAYARFEDQVKTAPTPWGLAIAARSRALLAAANGQLDEAVESLTACLQHHDTLPMPIERGRSRLHLGRVLRRQRKKALAAEAFRASIDEFRLAGASGWAATAAHELDRIGTRAASPDELTATEWEAARLAATGLTNRQVAEAMVLSPKSIDGILTRVYEKLAIHTRAELATWMARDAVRKKG